MVTTSKATGLENTLLPPVPVDSPQGGIGGWPPQYPDY